MSRLTIHDFSSALRKIDHSILVRRLNSDLGFTDAVLQWLSSHLTDPTYTSLHLIIVLLLLLYIQVFFRVHFLDLCSLPYALRLCLPLLIHTLSHNNYLLMNCNYRCLLQMTRYRCCCTLCNHIYVISKLGQLKFNDTKTDLMLVISKK